MDISQKSSFHRDYSIHEILVIFSVQIVFWHAICVNDGTLRCELVLKSSCDQMERKAKVQQSRVHNACWHAGAFQVFSDYTGSSLEFIDLSQKIREVAVTGQLSKI
jgi:hypothetical protein